MLLKDAAEVINRNYMCHENSLVYDLHETGIFSGCHFWEFYDSVIVLAKEAGTHGQSMETAMKITFVYQYILKTMIYHFDDGDLFHIKAFPADYTEYLERLDDAMDAYFRGIFADETVYPSSRKS